MRLESVDGSPRGSTVMADDRAWLAFDSVPGNDTSDRVVVLRAVRGASAIPVATSDVGQVGLAVVDLGPVPEALDGADVALGPGRHRHPDLGGPVPNAVL